MKNYLPVMIAAVFVIGIGCASPLSAFQAHREQVSRVLADRAKRVEIIRDQYGVPHIYGKTDADAVFGMLYAQAEDDFPRVERNYVWAMGRLAEIEGQSALYSDLRARLYLTIDQAQTAYENAPDDVKALCDAFADGLNFYLQSHPQVTPELLTKFEPWMPMFFSEGSIGGDIEQIPLSGIAAFYGDDSPALPPRSSTGGSRQAAEPSGSNGIAVSGKLTQSGKAMLLINPHTSFYFRPEIHVVSAQGLNAYGAVTWGQFFVYQGFSEKNGWMHTSTYVDFIDHFREDVFEKDGELRYRYGDASRVVKTSEVTLKYKTKTGMAQREFTMYHTHHGPVTHREGDQWVVTKINWDPVNALKQSFERTKTNGHSQFNEMMNIRTNSSNNTVYADQQGNIAYYHGNFIPRRDVRFDYSKSVDGSDPKTDWQGIHSVDESITLLNPVNGWIQNANSTPFTAAGAKHSPNRENFPAYMAPDAENFRGVRAVELLTELETGKRDKLTLDGLIELAYDPHLAGMDVMVDGLIAGFDEVDGLSEKEEAVIAEPIALLRRWNKNVAGDSVAMSVAHFYAQRLTTISRKYRGLSPMERLTCLSQKENPRIRLEALAAAVKQMNQNFGTWKTPWAEINRFQRITGQRQQPFDDNAPSFGVPMASGRWGALAAYGARSTKGTKKLYGYRGNSFVAVVEFGDRVRAKSLLAGGQSGDPESSHFDDQIQRYIDHDFKDVYYYRADVEAHARRKYRPGEQND